MAINNRILNGIFLSYGLDKIKEDAKEDKAYIVTERAELIVCKNFKEAYKKAGERDLIFRAENIKW